MASPPRCARRSANSTCRVAPATSCRRRAALGLLRTSIERLRAYYVEGGADLAVTPEMFDAVLATRPASPLDFDARLRALVEFLSLPDAASLAAANKRIANILRKTTELVGEQFDAARLIDPAEQVLAEQVVAIAREVEPRFAAQQWIEATIAETVAADEKAHQA